MLAEIFGSLFVLSSCGWFLDHRNFTRKFSRQKQDFKKREAVLNTTIKENKKEVINKAIEALNKVRSGSHPFAALTDAKKALSSFVEE